MIKINRLFKILCCALLSGFQCHKGISSDNPYGLPNASQNGSDVFACLINGQKFIGKYNPSNGTGATIRGDTLSISGKPANPRYAEAIGFSLFGNLKQGNSYPTDSVRAYALLLTDSTCGGISFSFTGAYASSGSIQLAKLDTIKKIASGTFDFVFPMPGCDTLKITNGRFDFQYY